MNFYEQNNKNLKKYRDNLYNKVIEHDHQISEEILQDIYSQDTKEDIKTLIIKKDNKVYRMNSSFYPIQEAEKWVKKYEFYNYNNVIIMFGLGNGIFADRILNAMNDTDKLIIYEPSLDVFKHVLNEYDMQKLIKNLQVELIVKDKHEFHLVLRKYVNSTNIRNKIICSHPKYEDIFLEEVLFYWREIRDIDNHIKIDIGATSFFGKIYIDNMFKNFKYLSKSIGLADLGKIIPKSLPVILVAAGPSVEENIDSLKNAKGKAIIVAVDRVLDYLLDNNIEPDIVATLDPVKTEELFSKRKNIKIPLFCLVESSVEILEKHKGKKIFCISTFFPHKMFVKANDVPVNMDIGTSVATMAFSSIIAIGFETVILVGQDLAYNGEFTHAGKVIDEAETVVDRLVDGLDGTKIRSRCDWFEFIVWYQDLIKLNPNINVYDTKSKGARIKGTILKQLDEIIQEYSTSNNNIAELIDKIEPRFSYEQMKIMWDFLNKCKEEISGIKKKAKKGYEISIDLINNLEKGKYKSDNKEVQLEKLSKLNKEILECEIYFLLDYYIMSIMARDFTLIYSFSQDKKMNKLQTYTMSKNMFQCILDACDYLMPKFEKLDKEEFIYGEQDILKNDRK